MMTSMSSPVTLSCVPATLLCAWYMSPARQTSTAQKLIVASTVL